MRWIRRIPPALLLLAGTTVQATLVPAPVGTVHPAGESLVLDVYCYSVAGEAGDTRFPEQLQITLRQRGAAPVMLEARREQIPPRAAGNGDDRITAARYRLPLPADLQPGPASIGIPEASRPGGHANTAMIIITAHPDGQPDAAGEPEEAIAGRPQSPRVAATDSEPHRHRLSESIQAYEPVYFLVGGDPANAKFQLSFQYRFLNPDSDPGRRNPWLTRLYMAYTQTSFWDLEAESVPFTDSNFKPELFYRWEDLWPDFLGGDKRLDLRTGIKHESNGEDGNESRSLNTLYLEPALNLDLGEFYSLAIEPRVWAYVGSKKDNPDIRRFRGNNSLRTTLTRRDSWQFATMLRGNIGTGRGALQLDLSYPVNRLLPGVELYLYSQFFTGFGENLLNYNVRDTNLRFGLGIVR